MKNYISIISILLLFLSPNIYSQNFNKVPKKPNQGDVFCYNNETKEWTKIDSELYKIKKEGKLESLQYKLKNLNYDVDITNCIDKKTIEAFEAEKIRLKNEKKINRKSERLKQKAKRKKRQINKET
ncbi:hypothetical protein [Algibacter luteus]|uniref:Uncharacterized protein n=1 Tax=Algibacter luteus TaxID=1178825 RepID=A0A1M6B075_9FLAO|nr:hypothetical protein [Algibacter luteus]SHI42112.1 hypothetical protein SAMN05216261_0713 [Algibacter luteus]